MNEEIVALFSYGTLRPAGGLFQMIANSVVRCRFASVSGYALYSNRSQSYPYLAEDKDATKPVYGSLLIVKEGEELNDVVDMELRSGYVIKRDTVNFTDVKGKPARISAAMFVLPPAKFWMTGRRIWSGDWITYAAEQHKKLLVPFANEVETIPITRKNS